MRAWEISAYFSSIHLYAPVAQHSFGVTYVIIPGVKQRGRKKRSPRPKEMPAVEPSFWPSVWKEIRPAAIVLCGDAALFIIFLSTLAIAFLGLKGLALLGYAESRIQTMEQAHFAVYFAVFSLFLIDLFIKVLMIAWGRRSAHVG
jgi:hypothetical protein